VPERLKACGVSDLRLESDYALFIFAGRPPDAIEVLGCPLRPNQRPSAIPSRYAKRNTYRFEMIDSQWFYWQFEPWGQRIDGAVQDPVIGRD
jgi:hypothetical protein